MALKNSLFRPEHKERSQPSRRATKYSLLEKHKDYVQRARDYRSKRDRLHRLRQKAADRNKDEFYFSMTRERTQGGVHVKRREDTSMPVDFVKVLKTQDENYIRTMRAAGLKKIERLRAQLSALADIIAPHLGAGEENGLNEEELDALRKVGIIQSGKGRADTKRRRAKNHLIFVDNEEEAKNYATSSSLPAVQSSGPEQATESKDDDMVELGWKVPQEKKKRRGRPIEAKTTEGKEPDELRGEASGRREEAKNHRTRLLKELSARLERDTQLQYAMRELEMQRLLMGKGGCRKMRGVERVDRGDEDGPDEDELDSMKKSERLRRKEEAKVYKPRVYKWRAERKK